MFATVVPLQGLLRIGAAGGWSGAVAAVPDPRDQLDVPNALEALMRQLYAIPIVALNENDVSITLMVPHSQWLAP